MKRPFTLHPSFSTLYSLPLPLVLWTAACLLFFAPILLGIARFPNGDFAGQFHAFALHQARELAAGRWPVWSSGSYAGFPFAADTQAAVFYPLRWITILLSLSSGLSFYLLELEAMLHIWLAGVFTYFLAHDITANRWAGLLAALSFGLGGYLISYPPLQLAILETIAWLPLILFCLRRGVHGQPARGWLLFAAVVLGLSALAGHPQTLLHLAYLAMAYFLFLTWQAGWHWKACLRAGIVIALVAAGVSAAAWLPALRYLATTTRSEVGYDFVATGFPLMDYLQTVLPGALTLWSPPYIGLAAFVFAALAWFGRRHLPANSGLSTAEITFWGVVAFVAAWLSLGDKGVLFEAAYHLLPGFALFRQQERLAGLFSLSLGLLAAQGLALWLTVGHEGGVAQREAQRAGRKALAFSGGLLLLAGILLAITEPGTAAWLAIWERQLLLFLFIVILFAVTGRLAQQRLGSGVNVRSLWPRAAVLLLLLLLAADLFVAGRSVVQWPRQSPAVFWPQPSWLAALIADDPGRIDSQNFFGVNLGEIYALEDIRGISPLKPAAVARYEQLSRPLRWQLLNVTHVVAPEPIEPSLAALAEVGESIVPEQEVEATLYRFEKALARAWMSYQVLGAANNEEALTLMQQPDFDPATQVVLLEAAAAGFATLQAPAERPVVVVEQDANGLDIVVETAAPGILVLSEWSGPGWRAWLDGDGEAPLLEANAGLQAVVVPAGRHTVTIRYLPVDVWAGAGLSLLSLLVVLVLFWRGRSLIAVLDNLMVAANRGGTAASQESMVAAHWFAPRLPRATIFVLILLGFALRIFRLGYQELRGDEAHTYLMLLQSPSAILAELTTGLDPHPPLAYLLSDVWYSVTGESEFALRYLSAVFGVLALPVLYQLGRVLDGSVKRWHGRKETGDAPAHLVTGDAQHRLSLRPVTLSPPLSATGLLAAALAAVAPGLIWLSQDVRLQYSLTIFFASLSTLLLVMVAPDGPLASRREAATRHLPFSPALLWLAYVITAALTLYSHYFGVFALLAHGLYLWFTPRRRYNLAIWVGSGLGVLLLLLPWVWVAAEGLLGFGHLSQPSRPELAGHIVLVGRELLVGSSLPAEWGRWLLLVAGIFCLATGRVLYARRPGWAAMLLGWLGLTLLTTFLLRYRRETFNSFYISVAAPAWWLLLAAGLAAGPGRIEAWRGRWRYPATVGLAVLALGVLIGMVVSLGNYYFEPAYGRTLGYRQTAAHLAAEAEAGDIFIAHFPDPVIDYYLRELDMPRRLLPETMNAEAAATEASLEETAAGHDRLWFVPYENSVWDPDNIVGRWLDSHLLQEEKIIQERLTLLAYRPLHAVNEVLHPVDIQTEAGDARLEGTYLTVSGRPVDLEQAIPLQPGDTIALTLLWEALSVIPDSYTVFVHLLDDSGRLLAQHDGVPVGGTRPTPTWQPGERLLDRHELLVPDGVTGNGRLVVGLYQTETVERRPFAGGNDTIQIGKVRFIQ